jgi:hypothetical protein
MGMDSEYYHVTTNMSLPFAPAAVTGKEPISHFPRRPTPQSYHQVSVRIENLRRGARLIDRPSIDETQTRAATVAMIFMTYL